MLRRAVYPSPVGTIVLISDGIALRGLHLGRMRRSDNGSAVLPGTDEVIEAVSGQLDEYFAGRRRRFDIDVSLEGTDFQRAVWERVRDIPYGGTTSYGALAAAMGRPGAARAVGLANGRNPLPIVVPCHRVLGADGSLTGYGGGLPMKQALLDLERRIAAGSRG